MLTDPALAPRGVIFAVDNLGNEIEDCYTQSVRDGGWSWLHLTPKNEYARDWILDGSGIPITEARSLVADLPRPRCSQTEQGLLFIGRGVNLDSTSVPEDMKSICVWLEPGRIITVVRRRFRVAERIAEQFKTKHPPRSPSEVLVQLFSQMTELLSPVIKELGEQVDDIRDSVLDDSIPTADISALSPLRLRAVGLHRYLAPLYDAAVALSDAPQLTESRAVKVEVEITRDQLGRIVDELAAIESRAAVTRDEIVSQRADQLNQRVYTLTVLAGVCLPLSVLTGMLGMNVGGIPLASSGSGFLITTLSMLTLSGLTLGVLRLIKWI